VSLSGRFDVQGALEVDSQFTEIVKEKRKVVVDLSQVTFIASLGIRTLVTGARKRLQTMAAKWFC
jgi:anti-anti-sigma factor